MEVLEHININGREIARVETELSRSDRLGGMKARWAMGRMSFTVEPGLYAVGEADENSHVFVSANYKMSFDRVRGCLRGRSGLILVLDTKGINVWCAAGKGTFGTEELVSRIEQVGLSEIVLHKKLIVPQLGAPGISAHEVAKQSGFRVVYGPVRAEDLPAYLDAGLKATDEMRKVKFPLWDRVVLIPVEIVFGLKYLLIVMACIIVIGGIHRGGYSIDRVLSIGFTTALLIFTGTMAAVVFGPILLPWLPGKAFSVKGLWIGLAIDALLIWANHNCACGNGYWWAPISIYLIIPAITSFIVMNFTGSSTYTSLSGVQREMKIAVPLQATSAVIGFGIWIASLFICV